ncbi:serine-rich coiled-coil domain-containing protein 2 isoform X2 [Stigmatopora argus]
MEDKILTKSAMVSRLPKFGGRSGSGGAGHLSNGSSTQEPKTAPTRPSGTIRTSPFTLKWKKDEETAPSSLTSSADGGKDKSRQLPSPGTPIMRRSGGLAVAAASPKVLPKQSLKVAPKDSIKLGQSSLNGAPKTDHADTESRLARPKLSSCSSTTSGSQDPLSQSGENLELEQMVRSHSFTHLKQIPSPNSQPMIRSFSFNRAVELAKPLANTQLRPPRSGFLKPPQLSNGRLALGLGGMRSGLGGSASSGGLLSNSTSSLPTRSAPSTPRALKKPMICTSGFKKLLGNSSGSPGLSQASPTQAKQQKTIVSGCVQRTTKPSSVPPHVDPATVGKGEERDSHNNIYQCPTGERPKEETVIPPISNQAAGDFQEDMSLSSASSLDKGNTSEEFLDDLDSVGDVFSDGDPPPKNSFLAENGDWDLADPGEESPMQDSQGPIGKRPEDGHVCPVSSLELSPSNSSGGTYMWDEEGLEPLGEPGSYSSHLYDGSGLNNVDILNNLPVEVDDDDNELMLDLDLPEDGLHDFNTMSNGDSVPHRQGQRRRNHRWNGGDHLANDGRAPFFHHYDALKSSKMYLQAVSPETRQNNHASVPDEMSLDHMSQDCSLVKNQLLRLKNLLQMEDTDSPADVAGETNSASQFDEMLKEVHMLREELRSRDKTIVQLTLQCQQHQREQTLAQQRQVRCQCQQQRAPSLLRQPGDKRLQRPCDKATQTSWRPPNHAGVLPTPSPQNQASTYAGMPQRRQNVACIGFIFHAASNTFQHQRAFLPGKASKNHPHPGPQ